MCCLDFETGSHYAVLTGLELDVSLASIVVGLKVYNKKHDLIVGFKY